MSKSEPDSASPTPKGATASRSAAPSLFPDLATPDTTPLTDRERFCWLQLIRSDNIGPATFHDLLRVYGSAQKAIDAVPELSRRGGARRPITIASPDSIGQEWEQIERAGARLIACCEADYPSQLTHIHAPPPLLTAMGDSHLATTHPALAIVGSRNSSASGLKLTSNFASQLGRRGYAITSGLARGIDTSAHKAALTTGTIAVVAGGLNRLYPKENMDLARAIAEQGLLISEMPWNWEPRGRDFPRRNRIISGLSLGTLVVEAAKRSGSLITARYALEQGRDVFAIPGSPLDPRASGTNDLIKQGAALVCEAEDILAILETPHQLSAYQAPSLRETSPALESWSGEHSAPDTLIPVDEARQAFIRYMGPTPTSIDELVRLSGVAPGQATVILLELDLAGRLERHGNQTVSLAP